MVSRRGPYARIEKPDFETVREHVFRGDELAGGAERSFSPAFRIAYSLYLSYRITGRAANFFAGFQSRRSAICRGLPTRAGELAKWLSRRWAPEPMWVKHGRRELSLPRSALLTKQGIIFFDRVPGGRVYGRAVIALLERGLVLEGGAHWDASTICFWALPPIARNAKGQSGLTRVVHGS